MKLFIKKNRFLLICLMILLLFTILSLINYKIDFENSMQKYHEIMDYIEQNPNEYPILPKKPQMYDAYSLFIYLVVDSPLSIIIYVMPFITMLCGMFNFYSKLKTGFFKDECLRRNYRKNIVLNILDSWKNAIIIPIFILLLFIGCFIITGNFDINKTIEFYDYSLINRQYLNFLPKFFIIYTINLFLLAIYSINIALIISKNNNNFFITIVQSYLIYIIVGIFTEVVIGRGLERLFPKLISYNFCNSLSIFNFWVYDNVMNLEFMLLFAFSLFLISTIVLFLSYNNKESVNLEIDK